MASSNRRNVSSYKWALVGVVLAAGCSDSGPSCGPDPNHPDPEPSDKISMLGMIMDPNCKWGRVCPHKGNDQIHNECADREGMNKAFPNDAESGTIGTGCDACMAGRCFDGIAWDSQMKNVTLFEVKTAAVSDKTKYNAFVAQCEVSKAVDEFISDCGIVSKCDQPMYQYAMLIADEEMYSRVNAALANRIADYDTDRCTTRNVQGCRR